MAEIEMGKPVVSRDGKHIGDVDRLVVDPKTGEIVQLIVKKGVILSTDRIVERGAIQQIDPDGTLRLDVMSDSVDEQLPEFVETRYITPREDELRAASASWVAGPRLGESILWAPDYLGQGYDPHGSLFEAAPVVAPIEEVRSNIDEDMVLIDAGTDVIDRSGEKVGTVDEVVYNEDGELTEFVVKAGLLFHHDVHVPADWVESITADSVQLRVTAEEAEHAEPSGA